MKTTIILLVLISNASKSIVAFTTTSSFTGTANSVCSREELTTALSCPPSRSNFGIRRGMMSMPPFLKKIPFLKNLKKPDNADDNKPALQVVEEKKEITTPYFMTADENVVVAKSKSTTIEEIDEECEIPEELTETQKLMAKVKGAGTAGIISYILWEWAFWIGSIPVCLFAYYELTGHWPDFKDKEDLEKLGAEAFAFVNFARFAVPLRIGLALSTTPFIQKNLVDRFFKKKDNEKPECVDVVEESSA